MALHIKNEKSKSSREDREPPYIPQCYVNVSKYLKKNKVLLNPKRINIQPKILRLDSLAGAPRNGINHGMTRFICLFLLR